VRDSVLSYALLVRHLSFAILAFLVVAGCDETSPECEVREPLPPRMRLLTASEYTAAVFDLLPHVAGATCATDADCDVTSESCEDDRCAPDPCGVVTFALEAPDGPYATAHVAGSFNDWAGTAATGWPMAWDPAGRYLLKRELGDGEHLYKFVVDDADWRHDVGNPSTTSDGFGGFNSVLVVACDGAAPVTGFDPAADFPAISRPEGFPFDNSVDGGVVTSAHVEQHLRAAEAVAERALSAPELLADCDVLDDPDCRRAWASDFASRAFRRPLTQEEIDRWAGLASDGDGVSLVIQAVLASPTFLYRAEVGAEGRLDAWETAAALSFFLWGGPPDADLRAAAAAGDLDGPEGIETHARRMLADPRARATVERFTAQWLGADAVLTADKSPALFPDLDDALRRSMLTEVERTASHVVFDSGGGFVDLLRSREAIVDPALANLYGTAAPDVADEQGFGLVDLPPDRAGVFGRAAVLSSFAHSDQTSPVRRGLFVRERLLCQSLGVPPADAGGVPDVDPNATTRERFAQHSEGSCAGCHTYIDDVGFGFEGFDAIGAARATDAGLPVDTSGVLRDVEGIGSGTTSSFDGVAELASLVAASDAATECYARHWFRFALGAPERPVDQCSVDLLEGTLRDRGDIREMLVAITTSDAFLRRAP